jgi:hypothetical protein
VNVVRALAVGVGRWLRQTGLRVQAWGRGQRDDEGLVISAKLSVRPDLAADAVLFFIVDDSGDVTELPLQPLKALSLAQQLLHAARDVDRFRRTTPKAGGLH